MKKKHLSPHYTVISSVPEVSTRFLEKLLFLLLRLTGLTALLQTANRRAILLEQSEKSLQKLCVPLNYLHLMHTDGQMDSPETLP